jgi:FkbM family methyltransferase
MNAGGSAFQIALTLELMSSMNNWYGVENWDYERFGPYQSTIKTAAVTRLNKLFSGKLAFVPARYDPAVIGRMSALAHSLSGLESIYSLLADENSKSTLVKVIAYRLLGHRKVKFPVNTSEYWSTREGTRTLVTSHDTIKIKFPDLSLRRVSLEKIGYPIELYFVPGGIMITFILKQYEYGKSAPKIKAQDGDYVIDAGGCWGDTALYFAHNVGERGKVYSFEFTPENIDIFQRNLDLNSQLAKRIEIVPNALWHSSGEMITYSPAGPGTFVTPGAPRNNGDALQVMTTSIDDFVSERQLPRVDFIKMDIEGAELNALKGAEKTIRTHKPRLAISVYHRADDVIDIPAYIQELDPGYEFFLDHFTIYGEETVLFARHRNEAASNTD